MGKIFLQDIIDGIKNDSFTINERKHMVNPLDPDRLAGYCDGRERVRKGVPITSFHEHYCFGCGEQLYLILIDDKELSFVHESDYRKLQKGKRRSLIFSSEEIRDCESAKFQDAGKLTASIKVSTGKLVFDNFFKTEKFYDMPSSHGYHSINDLMGRNELMQYLASENIGYGQLGNMYVDVLISKDKKEVIIAHDKLEDLEELELFMEENPEDVTDNDRELHEKLKRQQKAFEGFKKVGSISCSVWRWQCADESILNLANDERRDSAFTVEVKPGEWEIEHYYDFIGRDSCIYSSLKLKG